MRFGARIAVIIPAFNEKKSIWKVISAIPDWVDDCIVVDNGSTDGTGEVARARGARVVRELRRGYGSACLAGIAALDYADVVVFLDGDFSDHPEEMAVLVDPIVNNEADLIAGSRTLGRREAGSLTPQARFGNWLACMLIRLFWKADYTDLGPFRAIRASSLKRLGMCDRGYGWMVEMQIKATRAGIRVREVPVSYRRRIGKSKVSGTIRGVIGAGTKILLTIFLAALDSLQSHNAEPTRERLVIFMRYPEPGKAKTRLIPVLGRQRAAYLHRQMAEHTLSRAMQLKNNHSVSVEIHYEGGSKTLMKKWLGANLSFRRQSKGDLGSRLSQAFRNALQDGIERAVIIGTDCPGLTAGLLQSAFNTLTQGDVVIGPANDGGYYLIGLRRLIPELFSDIPWGTDKVLERTLDIAVDLGLWPALMEPLDDVDRPEDLHIWKQESSRML